MLILKILMKRVMEIIIKHLIKSHLHNLGQLYLYGFKLFNSKIYKLYKNYFDKYNRQIDYHVVKHILMLKIEDYIINSKNITIGIVN